MPETKWLLIVWAPLVAVVTVMCGVCLLCDAPPSPLRSALVQRADTVFELVQPQPQPTEGDTGASRKASPTVAP